MSVGPAKKRKPRKSSSLRQHEAFWSLLGQFVWVFSATEVNLRDALWKLSQLKPTIARAVLSGIKIDQAISLIRRIGEAEDWQSARKSEFDYVFAQLIIINSLRNDLLHNQAYVEGRSITASNWFVAHIPERIRSTTIHLKDMRHALFDLGTINLWLVIFAHGEHAGDLRKLARSRPWRYKLPSPVPRRRKNLNGAPKQKQPLRLSRG